MITEDYVSFETAKLLKEKGFCCKKESITAMYGEDGEFYSLSTADPYHFNWGDFDENDYIAPTIQMAMKWLEVEHGIFITVRRGIGGNGFVYTPYIFDKDSNEHNQHTGYDSCAEAEEAAIKYCLENLI